MKNYKKDILVSLGVNEKSAEYICNHEDEICTATWIGDVAIPCPRGISVDNIDGWAGPCYNCPCEVEAGCEYFLPANDEADDD